MIDRTLKKFLHIINSRNCPECGRRMVRVHRKPSDRILGILIPVIRCECCGKSRLVVPEDGRLELRATARRGDV